MMLCFIGDMFIIATCGPLFCPQVPEPGLQLMQPFLGPSDVDVASE